jgi:hypothetical protein
MVAGRDSPYLIFFLEIWSDYSFDWNVHAWALFLLLLPHLRLKNKKGLMKVKLSKFVKFIVNIINITSYYSE